MPPRKKTSLSTESLADLEARLAGALKPVAPPNGLTRRLRERVRLPEPRLLAERIASWKFFFAAVGGTISGLLIAITLARALFHLFGRRQFQ